MASSLRDKLEDFVYETEWAMKACEGDAHTKMIVASMVPGLVAQMPHMDLSDCPTYKGKRLMLLGKHPAARSIDRIDCDRMVYLGEDGKKHGIRAKVSSWRRVSSASLIPHAKASGQYLNSILAKTESAKAGYEEAILLDERGMVCEGSGENIFMVKDGKVYTPPQVASILDGISRKSVMQILEDKGYPVIERDIARSELYLADEIFMCGTAAEVVPVREVDDHPLGEPGEVTRLVQQGYEDAIYGRSPEYSEWLDLVGEPAAKTEPSTV